MFIVVFFGIFVIIIFIRKWFINYYQDQIVILRVVFDEVDDILSELPWYKGVNIFVPIPYGRLVDGHPYPVTSFFSLNIFRFDGTVRMISTARFSVHILILHHYGSDLAHLSDLYSLGIGLYKSER